ncbi:MAG TPA: sigma-70 family RNA polymerase sigma factor [Gemmataceae bacterium]|jgi:RNA polymerase sigma-70 factor (ECF subfamily)
MENVSQSATVEMWIGRLKAGDDQARKELLNCACARLTRLARKMFKGFGRVRRWEETDDVVQNALLRLYRSLADVQPASAVDFYRLAALNIRRELLDLAKHYFGPQGLGAHYASTDSAPGQSGVAPAYEGPAADDDPKDLEAWTSFHKQVEGLPAEEKEVFDLLWYQGLSQAEAAALLNVSDRTIKRRWASARLRLHQCLQGQLPNL